MLSYELLGSIASDGDAKASEGIMESVKYDLASLFHFVLLTPRCIWRSCVFGFGFLELANWEFLGSFCTYY